MTDPSLSVRGVILAAGKGTRMNSDLPKVLHTLAGRPLIRYAIDIAIAATRGKPVVVLGHGAEETQRMVGERAEIVYQWEQLGTGHAVQQAEPVLKGISDLVLVTSADMPLLTTVTLKGLVSAQMNAPGPLTILTVISDHPRGFGRIVRDANGSVRKIVEEAVATPEELLIRELNAGVYCISNSWLWGALRQLEVSPSGEYYLTDLVAIANKGGHVVQAQVTQDPLETIGINTQAHLAEAEAILERRGLHS